VYLLAQIYRKTTKSIPVIWNVKKKETWSTATVAILAAKKEYVATA